MFIFGFYFFGLFFVLFGGREREGGKGCEEGD